MTQPALLKLRDVVCGYGASEVLHGIDLEVHQGEVVSLLGANGAGKTTSLAAISGLVQISRGSIELQGQAIQGLATSAIVKRRLIQVPERRQLFSGMSVEDNLLLGAFTQTDRKAIRDDLERCYRLFPRLWERRTQLARSMSGGEQQMLAIARAMMSRPQLLLLDEPSLGLAPIFVNTVLDLIRTLRSEGVTILLVEQNARAALEVSDRGYVLAVGRIIKSGTSEELIADASIQEAYLGNESSGANTMEGRIRDYARSYAARTAAPPDPA